MKPTLVMGNHGLGIFQCGHICLGPILQGQTMVHWHYRAGFPVETNLHWFSNVLGLVCIYL